MKPVDRMLVGFKAHLRVQTIPAEAVCLVSERGVTALSGSSIEKLAPLLDCTRTADQIRQELAAELSAEDIDLLLDQLAAAGLTKSFPSPQDDVGQATAAGLDGGSLAYWDMAGLDSHRAASSLLSSTVLINAVGHTAAQVPAVTAMCRESGLTVVDRLVDGPALSLVLCEDYLDPALAQINSDHLKTGRPWLLSKPGGAVAWIGPVFSPGAGPCWACMSKRLSANRPGEALLRRSAQGDGDFRKKSVALLVSQAAGSHLAVLEAVKWLAGFRHEGQQDIYALDTLSLRTVSHRVMRRPQCPACGDPDLIAGQVWRLPRLTVRAVAAGPANGQRTARLEQVFDRYKHLVDPVTGVVPELRRPPDCPDYLHAYVSGRNRAMSESSVSVLKAGLRSHSGGKGSTALEAKVGALCEAVERYSATRDGDEPVVRDSYRGLGEQAVHPDTCQLFDPRQFADRVCWNATRPPFHRIPEPFDDRAVMNWTPVWSLRDRRHRLLPTDLLYFNPDPGRKAVPVWADSNGNAAGASLEDAITQGFFELVERDAVALWWYNRTRQPAVDLASFDDPWLAAFCDRLAQANRQVWLLDLTADLGIAAMAAVSRRTDKAAEDIMFGFGAHADPHIAARRALTELGQMLPAVLDVRADNSGYRVTDPYLVSWWTRATVDAERYLWPDPAQPRRTAASYGYTPNSQLDVSRLVAIVERAGLDIMVLDQTRPDIGLPVVKVVVPGLRHFWPRFAPGRLFDTPVLLGRLAEPTAYEELNPIPIYL